MLKSLLNRFFIFVFCFWQQPFHSTFIVWIKFDVWNQVVLQSSYSQASLARQ